MKRIVWMTALVSALTCAAPATTEALPITFEQVRDEFGTGVVVDTQYASEGVTFVNALALTAGISLNEIQTPPRSGDTAVMDAEGFVTILLDGPFHAVEGFFTYYEAIELSAYDASGTLLGSVASAFSANFAYDPGWGVGGDPGSSPNERLAFVSHDVAIARIVIAGNADGSSFVMDDFNAWTPASTVPEPGSLLALAATWACLLRARSSRRSLGN